jgi:sigma-E factor negative regulatory protein RseA
MADNHLELISAYVDGELTPDEVTQLLKWVDSDEQVKRDLLRYQYVSDVMNGHAGKQGMIDLTATLSKTIETEAIQPYEGKVDSNKNIISVPQWFWKQAAGFAVAASIGALAVVGVIQNSPSTVPSTQVAQSSSSQQNPNRWTVGEAEIQERLNDYLVDHNEYAGASGPFSYARVVTYSEE